MPIIGNLVSYQKVVSSAVLPNAGTGGGSPARGWTWVLSTGSLAGTSIGTDINLVPPSGSSYFYSGANKYGIDTGLVTLFTAPANGKIEISPINSSTGDPTITFSTGGGFGGGTTSTYVYVELNGIKLYESTAASNNFVLTLGSSQAGWVTANLNTLKYRIYHYGNGDPTTANAAVTISGDGIIVANIA